MAQKVSASKFPETLPSPYETIVLQRPKPRTVHFAEPTENEPWPQKFHVHHQDDDDDDGPSSSHHEGSQHGDSDNEVPLLVSGEIEDKRHDQPEHHEADPAPVLSAVPQYVRGEEHVSTFVPLQYVAPEPDTLSQPQHHQEQDHSHIPIHHPQPVPPPPPVQHWERPPSPQPPAFEPPKAEWDASRYVSIPSETIV